MIDDKHCVIGRAFVNKEGEFGNPLAVILDAQRQLSSEERTKIAAALGFSEIVFINDIESASVSIYTVSGEIAFAGHAAVGVAACLSQLLMSGAEALEGRDGMIQVSHDEGLVWVESALAITPPWWHERIEQDVLLGLSGPQDAAQGHTQLWAWMDEAAGIVRARTFAADWDIPEDEANGSGCMRLAATLGRPLRVVHGKGSEIYARLTRPGFAAVGGRVVWDDSVPVESIQRG